MEVQTFVNRKEADDYDKMIDTAYIISTILEESPIKLTEQQREELSIYLAENKNKLLQAFQVKKVKPALDSDDNITETLTSQ